MCIRACTLCFQTYDDEGEDDHCFQSVNKIVVAGGGNSKAPTKEMYNDDDNDEEEDTKYVLNQMQRSEESLKVLFIKKLI